MPSSFQIKRFIRFAVVGTVVAIVYLFIFLSLRNLGFSPVFASSASFLIAVIIQYLGQTAWTFGHSVRKPLHAVRFAVMVALGAMLAAAITGAVAPALGLSDTIAGVAVVLILPIFNFTIMSLWVYCDRSAGD